MDEYKVMDEYMKLTVNVVGVDTRIAAVMDAVYDRLADVNAAMSDYETCRGHEKDAMWVGILKASELAMVSLRVLQTMK